MVKSRRKATLDYAQRLFPVPGVPMSRPQATATELIDDARVRVTRFDFAPGAETGRHCHGLDYVIITLTDCHMRLDKLGRDTRHTLIPAGVSHGCEEGVGHNVINEGDAPMSFVELELK